MRRPAIPNLLAAVLAAGLLALFVLSQLDDDRGPERGQESKWLRDTAAKDAAWIRRMEAEADKETLRLKKTPQSPKAINKARTDLRTDDTGSVSDSASPPRSPLDEQANILTPTEVNAAYSDGLALQQMCIELLRENWQAADRWLNRSKAGYALGDAVRKDPDTYYLMPDGEDRTTFRRLALTVVRTIDRPECLPQIAQQLRDEVYLSSYE